MTSGHASSSVTFKDMFEAQMSNQVKMLVDGKYNGFTPSKHFILPVDDVHLFSYHIQQLMSEVGEVLDADKRWKNFRNGKFEGEDKLGEIADCFIVLMNIAMFSGFDADDVSNAIISKVDVVKQRIDSEN